MLAPTRIVARGHLLQAFTVKLEVILNHVRPCILIAIILKLREVFQAIVSELVSTKVVAGGRSGALEDTEVGGQRTEKGLHREVIQMQVASCPSKFAGVPIVEFVEVVRLELVLGCFEDRLWEDSREESKEMVERLGLVFPQDLIVNGIDVGCGRWPCDLIGVRCEGRFGDGYHRLV